MADFLSKLVSGGASGAVDPSAPPVPGPQGDPRWAELDLGPLGRAAWCRDPSCLAAARGACPGLATLMPPEVERLLELLEKPGGEASARRAMELKRKTGGTITATTDRSRAAVEGMRGGGGHRPLAEAAAGHWALLEREAKGLAFLEKASPEEVGRWLPEYRAVLERVADATEELAGLLGRDLTRDELTGGVREGA